MIKGRDVKEEPQLAQGKMTLGGPSGALSSHHPHPLGAALSTAKPTVAGVYFVKEGRGFPLSIWPEHQAQASLGSGAEWWTNCFPTARESLNTTHVLKLQKSSIHCTAEEEIINLKTRISVFLKGFISPPFQLWYMYLLNKGLGRVHRINICKVLGVWREYAI